MNRKYSVLDIANNENESNRKISDSPNTLVNRPSPSADSGCQASTAQVSTAQTALDVYGSVLSTPVRERYRVAAGCAATGLSPGYAAYRKLHEKASGIPPAPATVTADLGTATTNLDILAEVALRQVNIEHDDPHETPAGAARVQTDTDISSVVAAALVLPSAPPRRPPPKRLVYTLPDNLTSATSLRTMALRELETTKKFANREKKAKANISKSSAKANIRKKSKNLAKERHVKWTMLCVWCVEWIGKLTRCREKFILGLVVIHVLTGCIRRAFRLMWTHLVSTMTKQILCVPNACSRSI